MGNEKNDRMDNELRWTEHVRTCLDCKRRFRVSAEALQSNELNDIHFCIECVTGDPFPQERIAVAGPQ
jgi:hypothetical protein